jgi:hypothetical protein
LITSETNWTFLIHYDFCRRVGAGSEDPLHSCSITKKQVKRNLNAASNLRKAALDHIRYVKGATMYPLEHSLGHGLLCTVPTDWTMLRFYAFNLCCWEVSGRLTIQKLLLIYVINMKIMATEVPTQGRWHTCKKNLIFSFFLVWKLRILGFLVEDKIEQLGQNFEASVLFSWTITSWPVMNFLFI